jgi:hypothetical protein
MDYWDISLKELFSQRNWIITLSTGLLCKGTMYTGILVVLNISWIYPLEFGIYVHSSANPADWSGGF